MKKRYTFKVIIVGCARVGKSALLKQMVWRKSLTEAEIMAGFAEKDNDSSTDMKEKEFEVGDDCIVVLKVWDAVGYDGASITSQFYRESVGIIFLYDSTRSDTLEELQPFEDQCKKFLNFEAATCFLAANKIDDENSDAQNITFGKARAKRENYAAFHQVSAMRGDNVEAMFQQMAESLLASYKEGDIQPVRHHDSVIVLNSTSSNPQRKTNCDQC